ncbi:MAG: hypothetical protein PHU14_09890 [Methylovulum sp.]|nr:hypothetical protein [Methylovulum sp.]
MSNYFKGRGKLYYTARNIQNNVNADDGFSTVANGLFFLGNVSDLTLEPSTQRDKVQNFWDGTDGTDFSMLSEKSLKVSFTAEEASFGTMSLALFGGLHTFEGQSVSGAHFSVRDNTTKKWSEYKGTTALPTNNPVKIAQSISSDSLFIDEYTFFDPATVVVTDSSTTPKTLVLNTHYKFASNSGNFTFSSFPTGCTFPLKVAFTVDLAIDKFNGPIAGNTWYMLAHQAIQTVSIKDSTPTTPIVLDPQIYDIDPDSGMFAINDINAFNALGVKYPLIVESTYGRTLQITLGEKFNQEIWLRFVGTNVVNNSPVTADIYRVSLDPAPFKLIDKANSKLPFTGEALIDPTKDAQGPMGRLGRIVATF